MNVAHGTITTFGAATKRSSIMSPYKNHDDDIAATMTNVATETPTR